MTNTTSLITFNSNAIDLLLAEWSYGSNSQSAKNAAYLKLFSSSTVNQALAVQLHLYTTGIFDVIRENQPYLSFNLETLFGVEQWNAWKKPHRRLLGMVFATMVRNGLLPIEFDPNPKKGKMRHYLLADL